jgi:hypothetical protein
LPAANRGDLGCIPAGCPSPRQKPAELSPTRLMVPFPTSYRDSARARYPAAQWAFALRRSWSRIVSLPPGYAVVTDLERSAISAFAQQEGILLDPVYTGRAAGGMLALAREGGFPPIERVLFWHTGGSPALFAHAYRPDSH